MLKAWAGLLVSSLLLHAELPGWMSTGTPSTNDNQRLISSGKDHFPLNQDQQWFVKESYLIWTVQEDQIDYGLRFDDSDFSNWKLKLKRPDWDWSSGVRVGFGRFLAHHELWDISFFMTYYYNDAEGETTPKNPITSAPSLISTTPRGTTVLPVWDVVNLGAAGKSFVNWRLNLFMWDIMLGRNYLLTPKLNLHPFLGIRTALIYQKYLNRNEAFFADFNTSGVTEFKTSKTSFKLRNEFVGAGPRLGTDLSYFLSSGWSMIGSLSAAFFYSHYDIHTQIKGKLQEQAAFVPVSLREKDADSVLRTNLEGYIGLQWEKWVRNHSVLIAPSAIFEFSDWFAMNNWFTTKSPIHVANSIVPDFDVRTHRQYGDLLFCGVTLNLRIDF